MAGAELNVFLTRGLYLISDASYIFGFSKEFEPETEGYGSFNGNLLTVTVGISVSLGGCYYCN